MDDQLGDFLSGSQTVRYQNEVEARRYVVTERGISEQVCRAEGVTWVSYHGVAALRFEVFTPSGNPCGARVRTIGKDMKLRYFYEPGTVQCLSHLHKLQPDVRTLIWCEGDLDRLSFLECGFSNVLSCPGHTVGAGIPKYLLGRDVQNACVNRRSLIATDNDAVGNALAAHIQTLSPSFVRLTFPPGIKDANACLQKLGKDELRRITQAGLDQLTGLEDFARADDTSLITRMKQLWARGPLPGYSTGSEELDRAWMWLPPMLAVVTGFAGGGKTTFLDWLLNLAYERHGWKTVFCSFEQPPDVHALHLASLVSDLPIFHTSRPDFTVVEQALHGLRDRFAFVDYTDVKTPPTLSHVMHRVEEAALALGAKIVVVDPWNAITYDSYASEHTWIAQSLTELRAWAKRLDCLVIVVAHPTKPKERYRVNNDPPMGLDISGSAAWSTKADVGITVHRPKPAESRTDVHCWKLRWDYLATQKPSLRRVALEFEVETGRYLTSRAVPADSIPSLEDDDEFPTL